MLRKLLIAASAVVTVGSAILALTNEASAMNAAAGWSRGAASLGGGASTFNLGQRFGGEGFQTPMSGKIPLRSQGLGRRLDGPEIGLISQPLREGTCDKPAKRPAGQSAYCIKEIACRVGRHPDGTFVWEMKCATWKALR